MGQGGMGLCRTSDLENQPREQSRDAKKEPSSSTARAKARDGTDVCGCFQQTSLPLIRLSSSLSAAAGGPGLAALPRLTGLGSPPMAPLATTPKSEPGLPSLSSC